MGVFQDAIEWGSHNVFANTDGGPAEKIWLAPAGDWTKKQTVSAVVIRDHLQGSNEVRGDGVSLEKPGGRTVRESLLVEFLECAPLQTLQDRQTPDQIKVDGVVWSAVRRTGFDTAMKAYIFVRTADIHLLRQSSR